MRKLGLLLIAFFLCFPVVTLAANGIPFQNLQNQIDNMSCGAGGPVVTANGSVIGTYLSGGLPLGYSIYYQTSEVPITFLTRQGYLASVYYNGLLFNKSLLFFESNDCTGMPIAATDFIRVIPGYVAATDRDIAYFVPLDAVQQFFTINSIYSNMTSSSYTCGAMPLGSVKGYILSPNDPAITGVNSNGYTPPIRIQNP